MYKCLRSYLLFVCLCRLVLLFLLKYNVIFKKPFKNNIIQNYALNSNGLHKVWMYSVSVFLDFCILIMETNSFIELPVFLFRSHKLMFFPISTIKSSVMLLCFCSFRLVLRGTGLPQLCLPWYLCGCYWLLQCRFAFCLTMPLFYRI